MSFLACLFFAAALSAGNEEFEESAVRGAAEIAVRRLKSEAPMSARAAGILKEAMLADPVRYAVRENALVAGREAYAKTVSDDLKGTVEATLRRLAGARSPEEAFGTNFVRAAQTLDAQELDRAFAGPYTNAFAAARAAACETQASNLVAKVRPPMETVDSDDEKSLREILAANVAREGAAAVFEENLPYVSEKIVEPIVADAKREKRRQGEYVRRVRADRFAPSALRADIAWKLGENVRERAEKTENAALRWDVFPSVTNRTLDAAVEQRVLGRLAAKVGETPLDMDEKAIRAAYADEPAAHRTADDSRAAFRTAAGAKLLAAATDSALADAPEGERAELKDYLSPRLASRVVAKPIEEKLNGELDPLLRRVRAESAQQEFATLWPTLQDRTWYPATDLADDVAARSDFASAVRGWRMMPALAELDKHGVLEETDREADRAVATAFELARAAVAGQTKAVDDVKGAVLAESRDRKNSFFSLTPDLKKIVQMLTEATEARWREKKNSILWADAAELPANAAEQHAELFPSVKKRIELVAKEILEEMKKPEPEEKPEKPPEETPPEETPPEEPKLEFSILVSQTGDKVTVKLEQSGKSVVSEEADARLAPFRRVMSTVADKLGAEILKLK